jgi:hypothetical protein
LAGAAWRPGRRAADGGARALGRQPWASSAVSAAVVAARAARWTEQRLATRSKKLRAVPARSGSERARAGSKRVLVVGAPAATGSSHRRAEGAPSRGVASGRASIWACFEASLLRAGCSHRQRHLRPVSAGAGVLLWHFVPCHGGGRGGGPGSTTSILQRHDMRWRGFCGM